uniref:Mo25 n=1 Tax=Caligus clemensi TaxID=344056 RepID=C1C0J5_CALCM|nr:Mo25 [Caligus clemensi]
MPLFGKSSKSPAEVVRSLKEALLTLEKGSDGKKQEKAQEDLSKQLVNMKTLLFGTESDQQSDIILAQLSQEMYNSGLLLLCLRNLHRIDFEGKKDAVQIFNNILRRQIGTRTPTVEYICTKPEILFTLCRGYEQQEIALNCGTMLRECLRYEALTKILINSDHFYDFFKYVEVSTFDIASDAFATFKDMLTKHKMLAADFLETNFDKVFSNYQKLLHSDNYVTRRQSLKLLGELLLDRHNFSVMTRYISNPDNLKLMMNMLKDNSRNIQFEGFHVFKVFVANPNKPKPILDILLRNQDKLIDFLSKFHTDRSDDDQFNDEKAYLIKQIKELKPISGAGAPYGGTAAAGSKDPSANTPNTAASD